MSPHSSLAAAALAFAALAAAQPVVADTFTAAPVVRTLAPHERAVVDGLAPVPLADMNLRASAMATISAGNGAPVQVVQRKNLGVDAKVFAGLPHSSPPLLPLPPPAIPGTPDTLDLHDFKAVGDSTQAWATMTATGVPYMFVRGFGKFKADATAAWTSRLTLGGSTSKEVVLRFVIPAIVAGGNTELDGLAWWRSRLRADVMLNGFPVWSSEALRLRADFDKPAQGGGLVRQQLEVLQQFGEPLTFSTNDEDVSNANNSNAGNVDDPSLAQEVYLSLGRYNPGAKIELTMTMRGTAFTEPDVAGTSDNECVYKKDPADPDKKRYFCSRASMSVAGHSLGAPRIVLMP
jgi:hypothetical protein